MATPGPLDRAYSPFTDQKLANVPVLRIFGSTKAGQKACVHIHQVYPYFYVPFSIPAECTTEEEIQKHIFQFGASLNEAMNVARPKAEKDQHVAAVVLIRGVPFYGYHIGYQTFLKIYITNPNEKLQMLDVLQSGALENTHFQPHEAHLNFELQFLIDHNLYGMDWLHIEEQGLDSVSSSFGIKFRLPLSDEPKSSYASISQSSSSGASRISPPSINSDGSVQLESSIYTSKTVPLQLQSDLVPQESYCELEIDITGMAILNRHDLQERNIHTSLKKEKEIQQIFLAKMNDERKERLVKSLQVIWDDEVARRRAKGVTTPIPPITQIEDRAPHHPWSVEKDLRRLMEKMMTHAPFDEVSESQQPSPLIPRLLTLFQSVEALYPDAYFEYRKQQEKQEQPIAPDEIHNRNSPQDNTIDKILGPIGGNGELQLPSSSMPSPVNNNEAIDFIRRNTSEQHRTPLLNQFGISATPSRYRAWDVHSQVDKSVLQSFLADKILSNSNTSIEEEEKEEGIDDQEEDLYATDASDNFYDMGDSDEFARLVVEAEKKQQIVSEPTTSLQTEQEIVYHYRPRKLDLIEEAKKMDTLRSPLTRKGINELFDDADEEENDDEEEKQIDISDIPPDPRSHVTKKRGQQSRRIDQMDGASDKREERRSKRVKTPAERWEEEAKFLKRMRTKKTAAQRALKAKNFKHAASAPPEDRPYPKFSISNDMSGKRRVKSTNDIHPEGFQKVTVVIPLHMRRKRGAAKKEVSNSSYSASQPVKPALFASKEGHNPSMTQPAGHIDEQETTSFLQPNDTLEGSATVNTAYNNTPISKVHSYDTDKVKVMNISSSDTEHSQQIDINFLNSSTINRQQSPSFQSKRNFISSIDALWSSSDEEQLLQTSGISTQKPSLNSPTQPLVPEKVNFIHSVGIIQNGEETSLSVAELRKENAADDPVISFSMTSSGNDTVRYKSTLDTSSFPSVQNRDVYQQTFSSSSSDIRDKNRQKQHYSALSSATSPPHNESNKIEDHDIQEDSQYHKQSGREEKIRDVSSGNSSLQHMGNSRSPQEYIYNHVPPTLDEKDVPRKRVIYQEPFYSRASDVPRFAPVFAGKEFKLTTNGIQSLKEFESTYGEDTKKPTLRDKTRIKIWQPSRDPPRLKEVQQWMETNLKAGKLAKHTYSGTQLQQPTAQNTYNFKFSASKPQAKVKRIRDYIDYLSLEIHVNTREKLLPDPQHDPVQLIFWCLQTEDRHIPWNGYQEGYLVGLIAMKDFDIARVGIDNDRLKIDYADTEEELFSILIHKIRSYDPDMLVGYEVANASWGYLVDRGAELGFHLLDELSRVKMSSDSIKRDTWGYQKASVYRVVGRHMLNVWRLMRSELTLTSYSFENVAYHLLHDRIPHYSYETLTAWYKKGIPVLKYRLIKYFMKRVQLNLDMLDASQVVQRTCESARVYGIDFYAVLTRGSQYDVESVLFRIAKPENFVLITPSRKQVAEQRSLEILPLVMEPVSQFYSSPMVVLDFQSLYPSIMIAYNFCYSTCLGRIRISEQDSRFGVLPCFELPDGLLDTLKEYINVTPNGIMFVKPEIRKSTLAKMLEDLLDTRVMVKRAMKDYKEDSGLLRLLDAKQLTLKLLANVTYGYTSASFSGRMPSVEIADSIVATGRETLERAIRLINETEEWGARVVYGDTDSLFIYFPGKTKEEAFTLGSVIANTVTKLNPAPIKLKLEKVYHPAVLLAKKRYVGYKYESPGDEPKFEAKGIETVRRDGTAATQKIMESCLKILFRSQDMSQLKDFLYKEWTKILSNRVILQDFIIAKEVRIGSYRGEGPNGAAIAQAQMKVDARAEPQYGERVPYVVVYRGPNARLKDKVVRPEQLLNDTRGSLRLDAEYYIRKQIIPPLSRIFNLVGVDILSWYEAMPRHVKVDAMNLAAQQQFNATSSQKKNALSRIDQYYASSHCIICRKLSDQAICIQCKQNSVRTTLTIVTRQKLIRERLRNVMQTCQNCSKLSALDAMTVVPLTQVAKAASTTNPIASSSLKAPIADIPCDSLDCPIFYERLKAKQDTKLANHYDLLLDEF
ncbi:hypothetical protein BDF20DRAFT_914372 [Mycotypha africana]|uniref:uncharacterized protein n=1 Tax=Mycotypha africana TaxID=64632 RepID=UPI0023002209|nr:uncharacterized protein BDF20DRAFT_914372 [Mycotypha africana]KAI8975441.1 hypothetical protein BDF20DRAFT_914372 [Mycotypha africana]